MSYMLNSSISVYVLGVLASSCISSAAATGAAIDYISNNQYQQQELNRSIPPRPNTLNTLSYQLP